MCLTSAMCLSFAHSLFINGFELLSILFRMKSLLFHGSLLINMIYSPGNLTWLKTQNYSKLSVKSMNHVLLDIMSQKAGIFRNYLQNILVLSTVHFVVLLLQYFTRTFLFCLSAGSSSFESQKMDRPSISVMSPTSPGTLRDLPLVLPGQLSVSKEGSVWSEVWL